ncbi:hypothetical protein HY745_02620, partial [Candidatus Desantisbacteria bacterium]|nr:hypothetical protein [Candidatus Desantisbacteria bacterium]
NNNKHLVYRNSIYEDNSRRTKIIDKYVSSYDGDNWGLKDISDSTYRLSSLELNDNDQPCFIAGNNNFKLYLHTLKEEGWKKEYIRDIGYSEGIDMSFRLYNDLPAFLIPLYKLNWDSYYGWYYELGLDYCAKIFIKLKIREQLGQTIIFNVLTEMPKGIEIKKYLWNFEGTRGTQLITTEPYASYTYIKSAIYKARVIAVMEDDTRIAAFIDVNVQ